MLDERLDKLGNYFVYHKILERYEIPFWQFIRLVESGAWKYYVS